MIGGSRPEPQLSVSVAVTLFWPQVMGDVQLPVAETAAVVSTPPEQEKLWPTWHVP